MKEERKIYTPINLPKNLVERLKVLKTAYCVTYSANLSYDEIIDGMISELETADPKLFQTYSALLNNMILSKDEVQINENSSLELLKNLSELKHESCSISKKLHEVIVDVLVAAKRPLTFSEIAKCVNSLGTYHRADGKTVPTNQISARIKNYPRLFKINSNESPKTVTLNK